MYIMYMTDSVCVCVSEENTVCLKLSVSHQKR